MITPNKLEELTSRRDFLKKVGIYTAAATAFTLATYDKERIPEIAEAVNKNLDKKIIHPIKDGKAPTIHSPVDVAVDTTLQTFPYDPKALAAGTLGGYVAGNQLKKVIHKQSKGNTNALVRRTFLYSGVLSLFAVLLGNLFRPSEKEIAEFKAAKEKPFRLDHFVADFFITAGLVSTKGIWEQKRKRNIQVKALRRYHEGRKKIKVRLEESESNIKSEQNNEAARLIDKKAGKPTIS